MIEARNGRNTSHSARNCVPRLAGSVAQQARQGGHKCRGNHWTTDLRPRVMRRRVSVPGTFEAWPAYEGGGNRAPLFLTAGFVPDGVRPRDRVCKVLLT